MASEVRLKPTRPTSAVASRSTGQVGEAAGVYMRRLMSCSA
ncbi:MAG: hypothetical protein ACK54T_09780 [bacterium]